MTYRTIALTLVADGESAHDSAAGWAIAAAARAGAHLAVGIGVLPIIVPSEATVSGLPTYEEENLGLRKQAEALAERIRRDAQRAGASASVEVASQPFQSYSRKLLRIARLSDLCVVAAPMQTAPFSSDAAIDVLMGSGAPTVIVPKDWNDFGPIDSIVVGWDESAQAARAARGALPLMREAEKVDVVCVIDDKKLSSAAPGADMAEYLARHSRKVVETELPVGRGDAADALVQHAKLNRAKLLVMGAYGHARLREFVFGGATRSMLWHAEIPTLMAH